jgi:hypothetical protein
VYRFRIVSIRDNKLSIVYTSIRNLPRALKRLVVASQRGGVGFGHEHLQRSYRFVPTSKSDCFTEANKRSSWHAEVLVATLRLVDGPARPVVTPPHGTEIRHAGAPIVQDG